MLLFSNFTLGGHQGGHPVSNFGFERHHNFEKKSKFSKFQNKIGYPVSAWCPPDVRFEKSNISAFTGKKINVVAILDQNLVRFEICNETSIFQIFKWYS